MLNLYENLPWESWGVSLVKSTAQSAFSAARSLLSAERFLVQRERQRVLPALPKTEVLVAGRLMDVVQGSIAAVVLSSGASSFTVGWVALNLLPPSLLAKVGKMAFGEHFHYILDIRHLAGYVLALTNGFIPNSHLLPLVIKTGVDFLVDFGPAPLKRLHDNQIGPRIALWGPLLNLSSFFTLIRQTQHAQVIIPYETSEGNGTITDTNGQIATQSVVPHISSQISTRVEAPLPDSMLHSLEKIPYTTIMDSGIYWMALTVFQHNTNSGQAAFLLTLVNLLTRVQAEPAEDYIKVLNAVAAEIYFKQQARNLSANILLKFVRKTLPKLAKIHNFDLSKELWQQLIYLHLNKYPWPEALAVFEQEFSQRYGHILQSYDFYHGVRYVLAYYKQRQLPEFSDEAVIQILEPFYKKENGMFMLGFALEQDRLCGFIKNQLIVINNLYLGSVEEWQPRAIRHIQEAFLRSYKNSLNFIERFFNTSRSLNHLHDNEGEFALIQSYLILLELIEYITKDNNIAQHTHKIDELLLTLSRISDIGLEHRVVNLSPLDVVAEKINLLPQPVHSLLLDCLAKHKVLFSVFLLSSIFGGAVETDTYPLDHLKNYFSDLVGSYFQTGFYEVVIYMVLMTYKSKPSFFEQFFTLDVLVAFIFVHEYLQEGKMLQSELIKSSMTAHAELIANLLGLIKKYSPEETKAAGVRLGLLPKRILADTKKTPPANDDSKSTRFSNAEFYAASLSTAAAAAGSIFYWRNKKPKKSQQPAPKENKTKSTPGKEKTKPTRAEVEEKLESQDAAEKETFRQKTFFQKLQDLRKETADLLESTTLLIEKSTGIKAGLEPTDESQLGLEGIISLVSVATNDLKKKYEELDKSSSDYAKAAAKIRSELNNVLALLPNEKEEVALVRASLDIILAHIQKYEQERNSRLDSWENRLKKLKNRGKNKKVDHGSTVTLIKSEEEKVKTEYREIIHSIKVKDIIQKFSALNLSRDGKEAIGLFWEQYHKDAESVLYAHSIKPDKEAILVFVVEELRSKYPFLLVTQVKGKEKAELSAPEIATSVNNKVISDLEAVNAESIVTPTLLKNLVEKIISAFQTWEDKIIRFQDLVNSPIIDFNELLAYRMFFFADIVKVCEMLIQLGRSEETQPFILPIFIMKSITSLRGYLAHYHDPKILGAYLEFDQALIECIKTFLARMPLLNNFLQPHPILPNPGQSIDLSSCQLLHLDFDKNQETLSLIDQLNRFSITVSTYKSLLDGEEEKTYLWQTALYTITAIGYEFFADYLTQHPDLHALQQNRGYKPWLDFRDSYFHGDEKNMQRFFDNATKGLQSLIDALQNNPSKPSGHREQLARIS